MSQEGPWASLGVLGTFLGGSECSPGDFQTSSESPWALPGATIIIVELHCEGPGPPNRYCEQYLEQKTGYW